MTWVIALGFGLVIGLLLGALGGGGAILAVPVLVYLLGQSPQEATASSLVIVGVTSILASLHHARSGHVRWGTGLGFALAGVPASLLGSALNARVDGVVVLVCFALVMLASAIAMLWRTRRRSPSTAASEEHSASEPAAGSSPRLARAVLIGKILVAGLVVGFLTGFLGVGGGFIIVPALVAALGLPMSWAVGTSLFIMALNSGVSLLPRISTGHFDWALIVPFTVTAVLGSLLGKSIADRLPATALTRAFAGLLIVAGIGVIALEVIA